MTADSQPGPEPAARPDRVQFDYIKSAAFRVIHADGVVGGVTPRLDVHMDFWSERFPIPQRVVHAIKEDGTLGEEIKSQRQTRDAVVREVEAGIVMDLDVARAFRDWLNVRIAEIEKLLNERKPEHPRS